MPVWQPAIPQGLRPHLLSWVGYDFTSSDTDHHGVPSLGVTVVLSFAEPIARREASGLVHEDQRTRAIDLDPGSTSSKGVDQ